MTFSSTFIEKIDILFGYQENWPVYTCKRKQKMDKNKKEKTVGSQC